MSDDLLDGLLTDIYSTLGMHLGVDGNDDQATDWLTDLVSAITPLLRREMDRIDALTAERDRLRDGLIDLAADLYNERLTLYQAGKRAQELGESRAALADPEPPCPRCGGSGSVKRLQPRVNILGQPLPYPYKTVPCPDCTEKDQT